MLHYPEAMWTAGATIAAWLFGAVGFFLNLGGLWFIWKQLKANEAALHAASESAIAAKAATAAAIATSRPWIKFAIQGAHIYVNPSQPGSVGCQIDYRIKNIGQTPALQTIVYFLPWGGDDAGAPSLDDPHALIATAPEMLLRDQRTVFPGDEIEEGKSTNFPWPDEWNRFSNASWFKVYAAVLYRSEPDGPFHRTAYVVMLQKENAAPNDFGFSPKVGGAYRCHAMYMGDATPPPT